MIGTIVAMIVILTSNNDDKHHYHSVSWGNCPDEAFLWHETEDVVSTRIMSVSI